jgi:tRNA pseudouridine38-40 synthase
MRYAIGIEYDGSEFLGWQRHHMGATVQAAVEAALGFVANHPIEAICAGRTDAGVHARCQVAHFDSDAVRSERAWTQGANTRLPGSVRLRWCQAAPPEFHARYSARARRYRYTILNRPVRPALYRRYLSWERHPLDAEAMHRAAQALLGENDFSAFRTSQCEAPHARREMQEILVRRDGEQVLIEVQANAFLHHMVRNIVGSLLPVGRGEKPESWLGELLAGRNRNLAGPTAPAEGLVFLGPKFPADWHLPAEVSL